MRFVTVAATQMSCSWDMLAVLDKAENLACSAAEKGANIILLQELFETPYFCQKENYDYLHLAKNINDNPAIKRFSKLSQKLGVVFPISFFEKSGNIAFNSIAIIDADGSMLGVYRKTHIPDGHCYEEKFYFTPGDSGFKVWNTRYGKIGVGICWDQWFPESARCMALLGAEILFYPTAIGSEPILKLDSKQHWQTVMRGHSAANIMPLVASNRIGTEIDGNSSMTFYGSSFITDCYGEVLSQMNNTDEGFVTAKFDLDKIAFERRSWGIFRDRRPEMYKIISTHGSEL
jgi:N-carbamoylputrescine amidase